MQAKLENSHDMVVVVWEGGWSGPCELLPHVAWRMALFAWKDTHGE